MSVSSLIRQMKEAGASLDAIILAVEAVEAVEAKDAERRARDAARTASRRAKMPPEAEWNALRRYVFERDEWRCVYCGYSGNLLHLDHALPLSRGGSSEPDNLVCACQFCNASKGNRTPDEWRGE